MRMAPILNRKRRLRDCGTGRSCGRLEARHINRQRNPTNHITVKGVVSHKDENDIYWAKMQPLPGQDYEVQHDCTANVFCWFGIFPNASQDERARYSAAVGVPQTERVV